MNSGHMRKATNDFEQFITKGTVKVGDGQEKDVAIQRDTAANQSVVIKKALEWSDESFSGVEANLSGLVACTSFPLHYVWLKSGFVKGKVLVGVSAN